jgi:hypothetical protein
MCCSEVPHPCCTVEACCDAWLEEGLDQEPAEEEERARPVQLSQLIPQRPAYPILEAADSDPPPPLNAHGRWVLKE